MSLVSAAGSSPLMQGLTITVLLALGYLYFKVLRAKGKHGPGTSGK